MTNFDPGAYLTQYGPLGLFVLAFMLGWIVPGPVAKQKDEEIQRLQRLFEDEMLPMAKTYAETLATNTKALDQVTKILRRMADQRHRGEDGS